MSDGLVHRHDRRICWDCRGAGIVANAISLKVVHQVLKSLGWRFVEPEGRMVCPECAEVRRANLRARSAEV